MINRIILLCSTIVIVIGYAYEESGGLIVLINETGNKVYAKDYYMSSGGDDSFVMGLALMSFVFSFILSIFVFFKFITYKTLKIVYVLNFIFLIFIAFLVNLDVSIINSLFLGDFQLLTAFVAASIPFFFMVNKKAT
jgi:hypothetical protein